MLIVLGLYFGIAWLLFSKLKLLPWNRVWKTIVYTGALVIALVVVGALNNVTPSGPVSVQGVVTSISPNVSGTVVEVLAEPNSEVSQGDLLFRIDDVPFAAEVARLKAVVASAESAADQLQNDLAASTADIESLNVQLEFANQRLEDIIRLEERGATTGFQLQEAVSTTEQLSANLRAAEARKAGLERRISAQIDGRDVEIVEAEQALAQAQWNLEQTQVRAPADGIVTGVTLRPGNRATPLQGAISFLVPDDRVIVASLPQPSRANIRAGQSIRVALRTMPGREFSSRITTLPAGSAEGTLDLRSGLPTLRELSGAADYTVLIEIPEGLDDNELPFGASGTALVMTDKAGAIGILAEILFWITKYMNFI